jgi:hypothetical protein
VKKSVARLAGRTGAKVNIQAGNSQTNTQVKWNVFLPLPGNNPPQQLLELYRFFIVVERNPERFESPLNVFKPLSSYLFPLTFHELKYEIFSPV